jgi:heme exporter protein A
MTVRLVADSLELARGGRTLFRALSFAAAPGAFLEVRGANGSGKTSLLRLIAGYLKPRAGGVRFEGAEEPALAVHFVGHLNGLKGALSAAAHVRYWADLFGGDPAPNALELVGLARQALLPARVLSQGQARRLALARLMVARRAVWLLDEPAAGLDSEGRDMLKSLIQSHCRAGGIVLAALHEPLGLAPTHTINLGASG